MGIEVCVGALEPAGKVCLYIKINEQAILACTCVVKEREKNNIAIERKLTLPSPVRIL